MLSECNRKRQAFFERTDIFEGREVTRGCLRDSQEHETELNHDQPTR